MDIRRLQVHGESWSHTVRICLTSCKVSILLQAVLASLCRAGTVRACKEHSAIPCLEVTSTAEMDKGLALQVPNNNRALELEENSVALLLFLLQFTFSRYMCHASPQKHRVRVTESEAKNSRLRRSIAFFCHPDLGTVVECLHNTRKYPPVDGNEYIHSRTDEVYN